MPEKFTCNKHFPSVLFISDYFSYSWRWKSSAVCCFPAHCNQIDRSEPDLSALSVYSAWCDRGWHQCSYLPSSATSSLGEVTAFPQELLPEFVVVIPGKEVAGARGLFVLYVISPRQRRKLVPEPHEHRDFWRILFLGHSFSSKSLQSPYVFSLSR